MTWRRAILACAILGSGCGQTGSGPAESRLSPGQAAILASPIGNRVSITVPKGTGDSLLTDDMILELVGRQVIVEADNSKPDMNRVNYIVDGTWAEANGEKYDYRPVRITVMEGEYAGRTGTVHRYQLRPVVK